MNTRPDPRLRDRSQMMQDVPSPPSTHYSRSNVYDKSDGVSPQQSKPQSQMQPQSQSQTAYSQYPTPSYSTKAAPAASHDSYDGYGEFKRNNWPAQSSFSTSLSVQDDLKNDHMKKEAIAQEAKKQIETFAKQREEYLRKAKILKHELELLRSEKRKVLTAGDPSSHDNLRVLHENAKVQADIQTNLKSINNVIEILSGIIGDGIRGVQFESANDPDRADSSKMMNHKNGNAMGGMIKAVGGSNSGSGVASSNNNGTTSRKLIAPMMEDTVPVPISHGTNFNYVHYDPEIHWCNVCSVFPKSAKDYLNHLHSAEHRLLIQEKQINEAPWHKLTPESEISSNKEGPVKRIPIKGLQFFISATAWYCKLCDKWIGDLHCASVHLKSRNHAQNFLAFVECNPHWETDWMTDRERALEISLKQSNKHEMISNFREPHTINYPNEKRQLSTTAPPLPPLPPPAIPPPPPSPTRTPVPTAQVSRKKKKRRRETSSRDKKSKKKKSKKKKKKSSRKSSNDSSSTSSSSSSTSVSRSRSASGSESSSEAALKDRTRSIRVAMRNKMKMQTPLILNEEIHDKFTAALLNKEPRFDAANSQINKVNYLDNLNYSSVDKNQQNDKKLKDAHYINQWTKIMEPEKLLEGHKLGIAMEIRKQDELKMPDFDDQKKKINRYSSRKYRSRSRSRTRTKSRTRSRSRSRSRSYSHSRRSKRSSSRGRNKRRGSSPYKYRHRRSSHSRRSRSESRGRDRDRGTEVRRGGHRSRSKSGSRNHSNYYNDHATAFTKTSSPSKFFSNSSTRLSLHSEANNKVNNETEIKTEELPVTNTKEMTLPVSNNTQPTSTTASNPPAMKRLPFIGRMPLKKKRLDLEEIKKDAASVFEFRESRFSDDVSVKSFIPKPGVANITKLATPTDDSQQKEQSVPQPHRIIPELQSIPIAAAVPMPSVRSPSIESNGVNKLMNESEVPPPPPVSTTYPNFTTAPPPPQTTYYSNGDNNSKATLSPSLPPPPPPPLPENAPSPTRGPAPLPTSTPATVDLEDMALLGMDAGDMAAQLL